MTRQELTDKLIDGVTRGCKSFTICATNGPDNYEFRVIRSGLDPDDGHFNAAVSIIANGQYWRAASFIDIATVFDAPTMVINNVRRGVN